MKPKFNITRLRFFSGLMLLVFVLHSCKENLTELNMNPNALTDDKVNPAFVLSGVLARTTTSLSNLSFTGNVTQCVIPQAMQYTQRDFLEFVVSNQFSWNAVSSDYRSMHQPLSNAEYLETRANDSPDSLFLKGAALTMQAFWYGIQTSLWGDIPYTEANRGSEFLQPSFDEQRNIFIGLLRDLQTANTYFQRVDRAVGTVVADADLLYAGDALRWRKFANSLRLRYLMRLSAKATEMKALGTDISQEFASMVADPSNYPLLLQATENASLAFPGTNAADSYPMGRLNAPNDHEFYRIKAAATLVEFLTAQRDPRLVAWIQPVAVQTLVRDKGADVVIAKDTDGKVKRFMRTLHPGIDTSLFVGLKIALSDPNAYNGFDANQLREANGLDGSVYNGGAANPFVSYLAPKFRQNTNPTVKADMVTASEVHFLLAEAAERGWIQADAEEAYLSGIFASLEQHGVAGSGSTIYNPETHAIMPFNSTAFRTSLAAEYRNSTDRLELIMEQKWAAAFTTLEGWFDWRRTGYPNLGKNIVEGPKGQQIPIRYMYGDSELNYNKANTDAAVSRLSPATNEQWSKMWLLQGTDNPW
ncbi:SusD/RagB family nutrient-binding outer membrane lipoprotein [Parapedobacter deserti]|uniref:SusD/RagB family nutrient-binding outer membrane lipoprotein n=1 Tax=Parapedobacter deserti TaxID=1912957 RepID=A0ABV7JS82_9SPHI